VARFISPSQFLATVMVEGGWSIPTDVVPNAVPSAPERHGAGAGFAVVGRLREEKGVEVALAAARKLGVPITVAGDGPQGNRLRDEFPGATFVGHLMGDELMRVVREARAVVVPSLCLENAPAAVLMMASAVPVIASCIGGIPEQVTRSAAHA
jgi:glycosyltransferase involved in cell wall biosynthesis